MIQLLISKLSSVFALKQIAHLEYFLGIEVKQLSGGSFLLSQGKYICELLHRADMSIAKGMTTHLPSGLKLSKLGSEYMDNPSLYYSIVGALQYVTITRP